MGLFNHCKVLVAAVIAVTACAVMTSCDAYNSFSGSPAQQVVQHYAQKQRGGTYVGNASSAAEAKRMVEAAGYKYYNYYPSTGECFGYN